MAQSCSHTAQSDAVTTTATHTPVQPPTVARPRQRSTSRRGAGRSQDAALARCLDLSRAVHEQHCAVLRGTELDPARLLELASLLLVEPQQVAAHIVGRAARLLERHGALHGD